MKKARVCDQCGYYFMYFIDWDKSRAMWLCDSCYLEDDNEH